MRKFTTFGLSVAALAATGWLFAAQAQPAPATDTPAPAADTTAPAKPAHKHHAKTMAIHRGSEAGDAAVDDLNAKSLSAAKSGTAFTPPANADKKDMPATKTTKKPATKAVHHKKKAAPAADAAPAPAPDAAK